MKSEAFTAASRRRNGLKVGELPLRPMDDDRSLRFPIWASNAPLCGDDVPVVAEEPFIQAFGFFLTDGYCAADRADGFFQGGESIREALISSGVRLWLF